MAPPKKIVFVDTNVIIEAQETGCLEAILNHYDVRTVEEVQKEALTSPMHKRSATKISASIFGTQIDVAPVKTADILKAAVRAPGLMSLDKGELDLLAHVAGLGTQEVWLIATADRAAVKTACALQLDTKMISLEDLAKGCGQKPKLKDWYTKAWLGKVRTDFILGNL